MNVVWVGTWLNPAVPLTESHPCPVCEQDDRGRFKNYYDGGQKLYRCLNCGFVADYPGPGASTVILSYEEGPFEWGGVESPWLYPGRERALEDIADRILLGGGHGKLLDVGCGDGHFLTICQRKGFDCHGVEDSKALAEHAARAGAQIVQGRYRSDMFEGSSFDVISFIQVIEHIPDPRSVIRIAHRHLRAGGILCIEVPSRTAPHFLLYQSSRIKWFIDPPRGVISNHVNYFHPASIRYLTQAEGFEEISLTTGRWAAKYSGWKRALGDVLDPLANFLGVGGILYLGSRPETRETGG